MGIDKKRVLELYNEGEGLSISAIRDVLGYSRNTIAKVINTAKVVGLNGRRLAELDDSQIDQLLKEPTKQTNHEEPDFEAVQKELDIHPDVNLKLCWYEYHKSCAEKQVNPYM